MRGVFTVTLILIIAMSVTVEASIYISDPGSGYNTGFLNGDINGEWVNLDSVLGSNPGDNCERYGNNAPVNNQNDCHQFNNNGYWESFGPDTFSSDGTYDTRPDMVRKCAFVRDIPGLPSDNNDRCINAVYTGNANYAYNSPASYGNIEMGKLTCATPSLTPPGCEWVDGSFVIKSGYAKASPITGAPAIPSDTGIEFSLSTGSVFLSEDCSVLDHTVRNKHFFKTSGDVPYEYPGISSSINSGLCFDTCKSTEYNGNPKGIIDYNLCTTSGNDYSTMANAKNFCPDETRDNFCLNSNNLRVYTCDGIQNYFPGDVQYPYLNSQGMLDGTDYVESIEDCSVTFPATPVQCVNTCGSLTAGSGNDVCRTESTAGTCNDGINYDSCVIGDYDDLDQSDAIRTQFLSDCAPGFTGTVEWVKSGEIIPHGEYSNSIAVAVYVEGFGWTSHSDASTFSYETCGDDQEEFNVGSVCCNDPTDNIYTNVDTIVDDFDMNGDFCVESTSTCGNYQLDSGEQCDALTILVINNTGSGPADIYNHTLMGEDAACRAAGGWCNNDCTCSTPIVTGTACEINVVNVSATNWGASCQSDGNFLCDKNDRIGFRIETNGHPDCADVQDLRVDFVSDSGLCSIGPDGSDEYPEIRLNFASGLQAVNQVSYPLNANIGPDCWLQYMTPDFAEATTSSDTIIPTTIDGGFRFGTNVSFTINKASIEGVNCGDGVLPGCGQGDTVSIEIEHDSILNAGGIFYNGITSLMSDGSLCSYYWNVFDDEGDVQFFFNDITGDAFDPSECVINGAFTTCHLTKDLNPIVGECSGQTADMLTSIITYTPEFGSSAPDRLYDSIPIAPVPVNEGSIEFAPNRCEIQAGSVVLTNNCTEGEGDECYTGNNISISMIALDPSTTGGCSDLDFGNISSVSIPSSVVGGESCTVQDVGGFNLGVQEIIPGSGIYRIEGSFLVSDILSGSGRECQNMVINLSRINLFDSTNTQVTDLSVSDKQIKFWAGPCRLPDSLDLSFANTLDAAYISTRETAHIVGFLPGTQGNTNLRVNKGNTYKFGGYLFGSAIDGNYCHSGIEYDCDPDDSVGIAVDYSGDCRNIRSLEVEFEFITTQTSSITGSSSPFTINPVPAPNGSSADVCFPSSDGKMTIVDEGPIELSSPLGGFYVRNGKALVTYQIPWIPEACLNKRIWGTTLTMKDESDNVIGTRTITHDSIAPGLWLDPGIVRFGPISGFDAEKYCGAIYTDQPTIFPISDRSCNMHSPSVSTTARPTGAKCPTENHCLWSNDPSYNGEPLPPTSNDIFWNSVECVAEGETRTTTLNGTTYELVCMGKQQNGTVGMIPSGTPTYAKPWCPAYDSSEGTHDDVRWEFDDDLPWINGYCVKETAICDWGYSSINPPANPVPNQILTCDQPINVTILDLSTGGTAEECFKPQPGNEFPKEQVCCPFFTVPGPSGEYNFYQDENIKVY